MRRNDWLRRAQQCGEHVANIEAPLVRGAQNTREHLLRVGTASRSIAAATDFARNHRRPQRLRRDRKSTRLNSSHVSISYAVFCLKKKIDARIGPAYLLTPRTSPSSG